MFWLFHAKYMWEYVIFVTIFVKKTLLLKKKPAFCLVIFAWLHMTLDLFVTLDLSVTLDLMNMCRVLQYINKPSLVPIGLRLFKWGEFHILSSSYNLTFDDVLLNHQQMRFPIFHLWPTFGGNLSKHVEIRAHWN